MHHLPVADKGGFMRRILAAVLLLAAGQATADLRVMVGVDPSDRESMVISMIDLGTTLSRVTGQPVHTFLSQDLGDVMRSTRTGEYEIYIAPAHVAASALAHGYTLVGSTDPDEIYQLVARPGAANPGALKGGRLYLTQQDSVGAYVARGMLNESGQSLKMFKDVLYRRTSGAGLFAIDTGLVDATVAKRGDYDKWVKQNASKATVLLTSRAVPGGMSVVLRKDLPEATRSKLDAWFASAGGSMSGIGRVAYHSDPANYKYVSALGNWTPAQLPGATLVNASQVAALQAKGVPVIDVRLVKEYHEKHIRGAVSIPYGEKSLKDVAFDPAVDDWAGPQKLEKDRPVIFHCNGAECWKSYKAAQVALSRGFTQVYWFRGGFPEWEAAGLPIEVTRGNEPAASAGMQTASTR
jgi:rhodanese-related sulfurtransferase/ABC-type phosphate/phosphonate transport system substrate-binding protein